MTTTYREITNQVADQWVAAVKNVEQVLVATSEGTQKVAAAAQVDAPTFPALNQLQEFIGGNLPEPSEIVEANFDFANRVLGAQRDLALRLLAINSAAAEGAPAAAEVSKPAPVKKA